jgi:hypothetical protein
MAIGLVLRDCGIMVRPVLGLHVVSTGPIVRDDRGLALLFRCRAFEVRQLSDLKKGVIKGGSGNGRRRQHLWCFHIGRYPAAYWFMGERCLFAWFFDEFLFLLFFL